MSHFLYGKQRSERDFVRSNAGDFQKAGLDLWFQQGVELLHSERLFLNELSINYVLRAGNQMFLGVFRQSEDAVGRRFPLILGKVLRRDECPVRLSAMFIEQLNWYEHMSSVLVEMVAVGTKGAAEQFENLDERISSGEVPLSVEEYLSRSSLFEFKAALGPIDAGGAYALRTIQLACDHVLQKPAEKDSQTITIEFPAPTDGLRLLWLEVLFRRLAPRPICPNVFWTDNRMLVCLGPAPAAVLPYLANPEHKNSKFWPLSTLSHAAMAEAAAAMKEKSSGIFDRTEGTLLDALEACVGV